MTGAGDLSTSATSLTYSANADATGLAHFIDAGGAHALGGGVLSAGVAVAADGSEVVDAIFQDLSPHQFDSAGADLLGPVC